MSIFGVCLMENRLDRSNNEVFLRRKRKKNLTLWQQTLWWATVVNLQVAFSLSVCSWCGLACCCSDCFIKLRLSISVDLWSVEIMWPKFRESLTIVWHRWYTLTYVFCAFWLIVHTQKCFQSLKLWLYVDRKNKVSILCHYRSSAVFRLVM